MTEPIYIAVGRASMDTCPYIRAYTSTVAWQADMRESHHMEAYPYARAAELIARLGEIEWLTSDEAEAIREQYTRLITLYQS